MILPGAAGAGDTGAVGSGAEVVLRALVLRAVVVRVVVLVSTLGMLATVLPLDAPGTALSAVLALALTTGLLLPATRSTVPAPGSARSPDAPAADERCHRGVFRRQTSPDAPGRVRPRAPQPA